MLEQPKLELALVSVEAGYLTITEQVRAYAQRCSSSFDHALIRVVEGRNRPRSRVSVRDVDLLPLNVYNRPVRFRAEMENMQGSRTVTLAQRMHVVLGYSVKSEKLSSAPASEIAGPLLKLTVN